ncbi:uncharacterized protein LOC107618726 [Arachis ipaensis]|uniref:uncharacterized protein LOC107618726 n=1 Tax=Arachis ipaensis TaxID=130454 RepID=UPI0007AF46D5|nr:uncharacterized protein LOC107618726 [Arachis ipaensis]
MALSLTLRTRFKWNPLTLTHRFSTSSSDGGNGDSTPKSPMSSYFSDIRDKLKRTRPTTSPFANPYPPTPSPAASKVNSLDEIRKNLSEFRRRTLPPTPAAGEPSSSGQISFQEIYNRKVSEKSSESAPGIGGKISYDALRESMQKLKSNVNKQGGERMPLSAFGSSLKSGPSDSASSGSLIGGSGELPASAFWKEMNEKKGSRPPVTGFVKMYSFPELGEKLRALRAQGGGREGFSIAELNERLVKLRELEVMESRSTLIGVDIQPLQESLLVLEQASKEKEQRLDMLGHLGGRPSFMMDPPKQHLVERYFHPDNMSSAEKLKIELAKVREEFKMSESDCGSARVQVAQLTTKIKHLSAVLHKKDKHSRKGLLAMVQRRKRLLKYLRSTDWDSYCFVISKLGLRDNPDIKY